MFAGFSWSKWRDSNSRLPVPETGALPPALHLDSFTIILKSKGFVKDIGKIFLIFIRKAIPRFQGKACH